MRPVGLAVAADDRAVSSSSFRRAVADETTVGDWQNEQEHLSDGGAAKTPLLTGRLSGEIVSHCRVVHR
jgi:hypothetical protein